MKADKGQNIGRVNGFPAGRFGCYSVHVGGRDYADDTVNISICKYDPNGVGKPQTLVFNKKTGFVEFVEYEDRTIPDSLFGLRQIIDADAILIALAEALHREGYYPEVDNRERITAQALAKERKENIEYLRKQQERVVDKILE